MGDQPVGVWYGCPSVLGKRLLGILSSSSDAWHWEPHTYVLLRCSSVLYWLVVSNIILFSIHTHIYIYIHTGNNHPNWLIFFRGVETTNQYMFYAVSSNNLIIHISRISVRANCTRPLQVRRYSSLVAQGGGQTAQFWGSGEATITFMVISYKPVYNWGAPHPICSMYGIFTNIYTHLQRFPLKITQM